MKKIVLFICAITSILPLTLNVFAQAEPPASATTMSVYQISSLKFDTERDESQFLKAMNNNAPLEEEYANSPVSKMGEGVLNSATAWADIPREVSEVSVEQNVFLGMTWGLGKGVASTVARSASGVYDITTFGKSPYDKPVMKPEYKVDNPNEGFKVSLFKW